MTRSKVAVLKTSPARVLEDYERLCELAGMTQWLARSSTTILKDNISWHFPFPGANTTPWQLEGTIRALHASGYSDLVCVQNDTVVTDPYRGETLNKYRPVLDAYRIPVRYNCDPRDLKWIPYKPSGRMRALPRIYPEGIRIPEFFLGKNIVHLPTVKCHIYTTTTGAMKNAFGGLLNTRRHYTHSVIHETLVDLLAIQKEIHAGLFAIMDGTVCGNGPGPRIMFPEEKDLILASADQVAIDAVAARLMGFDPLSIGYIRLAHEAGLGAGDPADIDLVGEDVSRLDFGFRVGDNLASRVGDLLWFSPLKAFQKLFFRTPLVYLFVFGSAAYHDWLWYPTKGKRRIAAFRERSKWWRLFERYEPQPAGVTVGAAASGLNS
jgi:uncharacterized protein (DUF362 family)